MNYSDAVTPLSYIVDYSCVVVEIGFFAKADKQKKYNYSVGIQVGIIICLVFTFSLILALLFFFLSKVDVFC